MICYVKQSGNCFVLVVGENKEPCLDPDELWDALTEAVVGEVGDAAPVAGARRLTVRRKGQTLVCVTEQLDMHVLEDPEGLWEAMDMVCNPLALAKFEGHEEEVEVMVDEEDDGRMLSIRDSDLRNTIEELVGDGAAKLGVQAIEKIRSISTRPSKNARTHNLVQEVRLRRETKKAQEKIAKRVWGSKG